MKALESLNYHNYICFLIILLFTSIFLIEKSDARPLCIINGEYLKGNDSIKIGKYLIKIIRSADGKYGYDIYIEQKLFIHQPAIPAMPGNSGFTTKDAAEKVAKKVVEKMQKGESLPTISIDEMKRLGVLPKQQTS